jgi:succinate dehydrogenase / fumarate reductase cytochrome b subunit
MSPTPALSEVAPACGSILNTRPLHAPAQPLREDGLHLRAGRLYRLLTLTGLVPLGTFLVVHVAMNASVLWGTHTWVDAIAAVHVVPGLPVIEAIFVFAPLAVHSALGFWLIVSRTSLAIRRPYPAGMRRAVRVSGVLAAAFLAMHLFELRFRDAAVRLDGGELATVLAADLSSTWHGVPWRGAAYLIGTASVAFHFAAGVWASAVATSSDQGVRARRWPWISAAALGVALWVTMVAVILFHATGMRLLGAVGEGEGPGSEPCPSPSP